MFELFNDSIASKIFSPNNRTLRYQLIASAANEAGGILSLKYLGKKIFLVSDPLVAKEINSARFNELIRMGQTNDLLRLVLGDSILTVNGDAWLPLRQDINPFLSETTVTSYLPSVLYKYSEIIDQWLEDSPIPLAVNNQVLFAAHYKIMSWLVFGFDFENHDVESLLLNDLNSFHLLDKFQPYHINYPHWVPFTLNHAINKLTKNSAKILKKYLVTYRSRTNYNSNNISLLKSFYSERLARGRCPLGFTNKDELSFVKTIFYAATLTTALTLEWSLRILSSRSDIWAILRDEVDSNISTDADIPRMFTSLIKCRSFILEVTRLYPIIPSILRVALSDLHFSQIDIPKGSAVITSIHGIHTNPLYWDDPFAFQFDRFLSDEISRDAYCAFGYGAHSCPGKTLALYELICILALYLRRLDIVHQPNINLQGACRAIMVHPSLEDSYLFKPR